jgi:hypothetical protein
MRGPVEPLSFACEAGETEYAVGTVWDVELPEQVRLVEGFGDFAFAEEDYLGFRLARDSREGS